MIWKDIVTFFEAGSERRKIVQSIRSTVNFIINNKLFEMC